MHARRRAGELAGLRLALAEIAPLGIGGGEALLDRFGGDVDDAGAWNRTKGRDLVAHDERNVSRQSVRMRSSAAWASLGPAKRPRNNPARSSTRMSTRLSGATPNQRRHWPCSSTSMRMRERCCASWILRRA